MVWSSDANLCFVRVIEVVPYSRPRPEKCKLVATSGEEDFFGERALFLARAHQPAVFEQDDVVKPRVGCLATDNCSDQLDPVAALQAGEPAIRIGCGVTDDIGRKPLLVPAPLAFGSLVQLLNRQRGARRDL